MPQLTTTITKTTAGISPGTIKSLHSELAALGLPVSGPEAGTRFGPDTQTRVRAFQRQYHLPETGDLDPTSGGIMSLAALVATERDLKRLKTALRAAQASVPNSPQYNSWLGRSALIAGDYDLAARFTTGLKDLSGTGVNLSDITGNNTGDTSTGSGPPRQPEVPFPENFYTYRYAVMAQDDIDSLTKSASALPAGIALRPANGPNDPPYDPVINDPPPTPPAGAPRPQRLADSARAWLDAIEAWQFGNAEFARQRYASAIDAYNRCQQAALSYFSIYPDYGFRIGATTLAARIDELVADLASDPVAWADVWMQINWRRQLLSLAELSQFDWTPVRQGDIVYQLLQANLAGSDQPPTNPVGPEHRKRLMDSRLLILAAVIVPLARGEANRLRRQYAAAKSDFTRVLMNVVAVPDSNPPQAVAALLKCDFIEAPFARLLLAETLLDQAEAQYKARLSVDDETDHATQTRELAVLAMMVEDFNARHITGDGNAARPFQHLVAALTYAGVLDAIKDDGEYVARAKEAVDSLHKAVDNSLAAGDVSSMAFRSIGQTITIKTVSPLGNALPGLFNSTHPHESYLKFDVPAGQQAMRERNPRVYALLLQAQARLVQIWKGFNYLGYRDDYVPPWRFQFLVDRARYFSEHAKNAQRDYLNFLGNAESEELKEMSAAQNVEMEKANVQIEAARVHQARTEVTSSEKSLELAELNATDAQQRVDKYSKFAEYADELFDTYAGAETIVNEAPEFVSNFLKYTGAVSADQQLTGFGDMFGGGAVSNRKNALVAHAQRNVELLNLQLAVDEAKQSRKVANAQLQVARAGFVVAGLQRQAALLRHEFAVQNLQFMRNRTLNTEQWYRLAGAIRSVGDTYLRYAIEMAFLAQQAYDFETDSRLNVIRFDYDASEVGAMLAADFLLRDLDGLEHDLVSNQQTRQQQVRYVVSMAREFPESLRALADTGEVTISLRLEQLERHFPGLANLRISSVELQPVALMDPTRVSIELTHLGTGMVRLKAQPGTSPLNDTDLAANGDWLPNAAANWPIKIHVSGPDTAVFSGLSRQDIAGLSMISANQRAAFEGLPAASSWRIDLSQGENQIVPDTLADVVIAFTLSGYYDAELNDVVTNTASSARTLATTAVISARRVLPDAYYSLVHYGKVEWPLSERMLSLTGTPNELHNIAVLLPLTQNAIELGRCYCRYPIRVDIAAGAVTVLTALPQFTLASTGLKLDCAFTGIAGSAVTWDFGDNTPLAQGPTAQHLYARPGLYQVVIRLAKDQKLVEYRAAVAVSASRSVVSPLIVSPTFSTTAVAPDGSVTLTVAPPANMPDVSIDCAVAKVRAGADTGPVTLKLKPGRYELTFVAMRKIAARFYSKQRYLPAVPVTVYRQRVATNRTFDSSTGANTTTAPNQFTTQLFGSGNVTISPADRWTLELPLAENPCFATVSSSDVVEFDGSELNDALLSLEFLAPQ